MEFATGALGSLVPKLGQLLQDEYKLQKGAKKDIEFLERELESMRAALWNVGEVPPEQVNELLMIWARDVRDLSYDMEDIVDTFLVRVEGPKSLHFIKEMMQKIIKATTRRWIAQEIKGIKERVKELADRRERYTVNDIIRPQTTMFDPRLHALYAKATDLIGIEKAREELITKLTKSDDLSMQQQKIVSIVGIGGLGKTTLAKAVYDKLKIQFKCSAFVTLSRNPDMRKVLKDMLYELDTEVYRNIHGEMLDEKHLIDLVQKFLINKRYIIVIDDIWEPRSWETIKLALPEKNCGSIIIATTRKLEAATEVGEIYKLRSLSHDNSKKLFNTRIFGFEQKCMDDQQDEVSNKFLKKCDGIPLAIITMASLLVGKPRETWDEIYTAIGFGHKDNMQVENTMRILSFSYYDMPSHLRTCLLYLNAFPEDYVIDKYSLILKWIAEGFIPEEQGKVLFELGEQYFSELINRSMIQAVESEDNVEVKGCRVHDMILDFVRSVSQEKNFITVLDNGECISSQNKYKVRRLAFHKTTMEHISSQIDQEDMPKVRTYIASMCSIDQQVALLGFKLLRVLAIEDCRFKKDCQLENIGNLTHLRYLSLRSTIMDNLPEQIGKLKFLQTLDLQHTWMKQLPASMVKLTRLVCLLAGSLEVLDRIGNLTSLQQLTLYIRWRSKDVQIIRKFVKELGNLTELRMLEITCFWTQGIKMDESLQRDLVECLGKLHKIQHIQLQSFEYSTLDGTWEGAGFVLPQHVRHLSLSFIVFPSLLSCVDVSRLYHLSSLELSVVALDDFDLKLLGRLTELRYLNLDIRIKANATVSNINARDGCFFPKLTVCKIHGAMVQFEYNEDPSFSFHIWDGIDIDRNPFGSRRYGGCGVCSAIMPKVEVLQLAVYVEPVVQDQFGYCNTIGWEYLTSLRKVIVYIFVDSSYRGGPSEQVKIALREAINSHPNCPTFEAHQRFLCRY